MSIVSQAAAICHEVTRSLHGESVTVTDRDGAETVITDAVVTLETASVGDFGSGAARWNGVIRFKASRHTLLKECNLVETRGHVWNIVAVEDPFSDSFRAEIRRDEQNHTNLSDLADNQAVWAPEE